MPYIEDLYPTNRESGNLVDDKSLAWPWNLKSSKTFKGKNTNKILLERKGSISISPLTTTGSRMLERNNKLDL